MSEERRERTLELDRLVNFSDAVFAIAATMLVLTIQFPQHLHGPGLDSKVWREYRDACRRCSRYGKITEIW